MPNIIIFQWLSTFQIKLYLLQIFKEDEEEASSYTKNWNPLKSKWPCISIYIYFIDKRIQCEKSAFFNYLIIYKLRERERGAISSLIANANSNKINCNSSQQLFIIVT